LGNAGAWSFAAGFLIATVLLHIAGLGLGMGLSRLANRGIVARILGGVTALAGASLLFG